MRAVFTVARHEMRLLFLASGAWVFLAAFQALAGLLFVISVASSGEAGLRDVVPNWVVLFVFCSPLVTMGQLAGERQSGTLELLVTAPLELHHIVLGKWMAAVGFFVVLLAATSPIVGTLVVFGTPDLGVLLCTYVGLLLCCGCLAAVGLFASSLTADPLVAGVSGVAMVLPAWLAGQAATVAPPQWEPLLMWLSLSARLRDFLLGVLDTGDVAWFALLTLGFLFAAWRTLEAKRWA